MRFFKYFAHYVFNYRAYILLLFFKKYLFTSCCSIQWLISSCHIHWPVRRFDTFDHRLMHKTLSSPVFQDPLSCWPPSYLISLFFSLLFTSTFSLYQSLNVVVSNPFFQLSSVYELWINSYLISYSTSSFRFQIIIPNLMSNTELQVLAFLLQQTYCAYSFPHFNWG